MNINPQLGDAMKNKITNTAAMAADVDGARTILAEAMLAQMMGRSPSATIEDMEARGQEELCESSVLPARYNTDFYGRGDGQPKPGRVALEAAGVKFLGPVDGDPLFERVEFPAGWTSKPTEHAMWSDVLDAQGRIRAKVFYKAAFYDRKAHTEVRPRFSVHYDSPDNFHDPGPYVACVQDGGETVVWRSPELFDDPRLPPDNDPGYAVARDKLIEEIGWGGLERLRGFKRALDAGKAWLDEHYPDHESLTAYW